MSTRPVQFSVQLAALVFVFASCAAAQGLADKYRQEISKLDSAHPESVCKARDSLRVLMPTANAQNRAAMFRAFREFYLDAVASTYPAFSKQMEPYSDKILEWFMKSEGPDPLAALLKSSPEIRKAGAAWFDCGFSVMEGEGNVYPNQSSDTLLLFANQLPSDLESYVRFRAREDAQIVLKDACLQITWDELRQRLARWETFARKHPDLAETESEVQPEVKWLATIYLFGSDNSQTFNVTTGQVEPKLLASWQRFVSEDRASGYHPLLTSLVARLVVDKLLIMERDRPLFERVGLGEDFDIWWRNSRQQR